MPPPRSSAGSPRRGGWPLRRGADRMAIMPPGMGGFPIQARRHCRSGGGAAGWRLTATSTTGRRQTIGFSGKPDRTRIDFDRPKAVAWSDFSGCPFSPLRDGLHSTHCNIGLVPTGRPPCANSCQRPRAEVSMKVVFRRAPSVRQGVSSGVCHPRKWSCASRRASDPQSKSFASAVHLSRADLA